MTCKMSSPLPLLQLLAKQQKKHGRHQKYQGDDHERPHKSPHLFNRSPTPETLLIRQHQPKTNTSFARVGKTNYGLSSLSAPILEPPSLIPALGVR